MKRSIYIYILLYFSTVVCYSQETHFFDVKKLQINWELITNNYNKEEKASSVLKFINNSKIDFPSSGWILYFNYNRKIFPVLVDSDFSISHINGDLFQIKPSADFKGIKSNQSASIKFVSEGSILNLTAAPSGIYLVWDSNLNNGITVENYNLKPILDPTVNFITTEETFKNNKKIENIPIEKLPKIFPTPKYIKENEGEFVLDSNVSITSEVAYLSEANYLSKEIFKIAGIKIAVNPIIKGKKEILIKGENLNLEEYILNIQSDKIEISAKTGSGIFYGIQSIKSLLPLAVWKNKSTSIVIKNCYVKDEPRFEFRSFMIDVARNFQSKESIFKILDAMSLYKMNAFHFHFSDDEGWRIQIPSLPELTEIGGKRGHSVNTNNYLLPSYGSGPNTGSYPGSGYYSTQDFIAILKYATERHIQVIPEIESPGHSRAAIKAMDSRYEYYMKLGNQEEAERYLLRDINDKSIHTSAQLWTDNVMCVALPSTYSFLEKVIDEILNLYKEANAPIETIHLGGDEVPSGTWELSPLCTKLIAENKTVKSTDDLWYYYFDKMDSILSKRNLKLSGWEEIAMRKTIINGEKKYIPNLDFINKGFRAHVWNNGIGWGSEDLPYKLANAGYKVVLSCVSNLYFDLPYEKAADEPGNYWGGFNNIDKPFYFIPFNYYKNTKEDTGGNPIEPSLFIGKERLTAFGESNILGIQGQLFSENVRNTTILEYLLFPKLLALAERNWVQNPTWVTEKDEAKSELLYNKDWSIFVNVLGKKELPLLDYYFGGYKYRIPPVGTTIQNGIISANIQMPGFTIRYTTDGSEPNLKSKIYSNPINTKGKITFCAFSSNGRKSKLTKIENQ